MARGPLHAPPVVALGASASQASSSVSAGSVMEAVDAAATFAAVKQKLNPTPFNDWLLSSTSTEPDEKFALLQVLGRRYRLTARLCRSYAGRRGAGRRFLRGTNVGHRSVSVIRPRRGM